MTFFPPTRRADFERRKTASRFSLGVIAELRSCSLASDGLLAWQGVG
jgi:hypothetical protein